MRHLIIVSLFSILSASACVQGPEGAPTISTAAAAVALPQPTALASEPKRVIGTENGGHSWHDASAGLPADMVALDLVGGNDLTLLTPNGLLRSQHTPMGLQWAREVWPPEGVERLYDTPNGLCVRANDGMFFQDLPTTGIWLPVYAGLAGKSIRDFDFQPNGLVLAAGEQGIFRSADEGATWQQVRAGQVVTSLTFSRGIWLAGTERGILRSTDGGIHWVAAPEAGSTFALVYALGAGVVALVEGPRSPSSSPSGGLQQLLYSTDGGVTWAARTAGLPANPHLYQVQQLGDLWFCSEGSGVYISRDEGLTWRRVYDSPDNGWYKMAVSGSWLYLVLAGGC